MRTVRHGPAVVGSQQHLAVRPRRPAPAIARVIPTTAARTSRRSVRSLLTTITAVTRSRPTTTIAVIRCRAPTIRLLPVLIRRREHIPHRAAATQPRLAPTQHPVVAVEAVAIAVEEEAAAGVAEAVEATSAVAAEVTAAAEAVARAVVVEVAEARTAVEVPAHTVTVKSFCKLKGPPESPGRAFCFCVPSMSDNWEVQVLFTTRWR